MTPTKEIQRLCIGNSQKIQWAGRQCIGSNRVWRIEANLAQALKPNLHIVRGEQRKKQWTITHRAKRTMCVFYLSHCFLNEPRAPGQLREAAGHSTELQSFGRE